MEGGQLKKALIYGINGQDGSYLAELLLAYGYEVHGVIRKTSSFNTKRIDHIFDQLHLHYGDITDASHVNALIHKLQPDEVYNLAAQSQVKVSFELPHYTSQVVAIGCLNLLEAIKNYCPSAKFYQAGSSEMFGNSKDIPQNELTPFNPQSPYAVAKVFAHQMVKNYRDAYKLFAVNGILFNHESARRGETFVTRKIALGIRDIHRGIKETLVLGNLDAYRDWGHAKDYVIAIHMMLQNSKPIDYVVATGMTYSVRDFVTKAFEWMGIELEWVGTGVNEIGRSKDSLITYVEIDKKYFRPTEVDLLCGDASKIHKELNWKPRYGLDYIIKDMMTKGWDD